MCDCQVCQNNRIVEQKISELPADKQEFFNELHDAMLHIEFDNDYYKAVMSGKWPGGREALEQALEKYPK